jgi:hypothetical protein
VLQGQSVIWIGNADGIWGDYGPIAGGISVGNTTLSCDHALIRQGFSTIMGGTISRSQPHFTPLEEPMDRRYADPIRPDDPASTDHRSVTAILTDVLILGLVLLSMLTGVFSWAFVEADLFM